MIMEHIVYLALGSNMGNRAANLKAAIDNLTPQITLKKKSAVYETPPWGYEDQPAFLNMAIKGETSLKPELLLKYLKQLEVRLGRQPSFPWGPRSIDIDILFFDDLILDSPALKLPHPHLQERAFVLVPLTELAPYLRHPVLNKSMNDLLEACDTSGIEKYRG